GRVEGTGRPRRVWVEPRTDAADVTRALRNTGAASQAELPGLDLAPAGPGTYEVTLPSSLDGGHETHFARVLDQFLTIVDDRRWPAAAAERTLAKYALLAEAAAMTREAR